MMLASKKFILLEVLTNIKVAKIIFYFYMHSPGVTQHLLFLIKAKHLKLLEKRQDLQVAAQVFNRIDASHESISSNGIRFFLSIYAPIKEVSNPKYVLLTIN